MSLPVMLNFKPGARLAVGPYLCVHALRRLMAPAGCTLLVSEARVSRSLLRTPPRHCMHAIGSCALVNQVLMTRDALP